MRNHLADHILGLFRPRNGAHRITGHALVLGGDSILVAGHKIILHGIDAPEMDQVMLCRDQELMCGAMALAALEALIAGMEVRCEIVEHNRIGCAIAKVYSPNGVDIGKRMVWAGWALAYRRYSDDYIAAEEAARKACRGLWRGEFTKPWEWRASYSQRRQADGAKQRHDSDTMNEPPLETMGADSGHGL